MIYPPSKSTLLFFNIYFIEGLITVFFCLNVVYLMERHIDLSAIGILGFIALTPLLFKPFIGALSDKIHLRSYGRRRPFMAFFVILQSLSFFFISFIDPNRSYQLYLAVMTLVIVALAFYDTSADGLALDLLKKSKYGFIQFVMTSSRYFAVLLVTPILTLLADRVSWASVFISLSVLSLLPIPLIFLVREPGLDSETTFSWMALFRYLKPPKIYAIAIGFLIMFVTSGTEEILLGYLKADVGISLDILGIFSTISGVGIILGALIGAFLYRSYGIIKSIAITSVITSLSVILLSAIVGTMTAVYFAFLFGLSMGILHVTVFSLGMAVAERGSEASTFGLFSTFMALGTMTAFGFSPWFSQVAGFRYTFILNGTVALLILLMLFLLKSTSASLHSPISR